MRTKEELHTDIKKTKNQLEMAEKFKDEKLITKAKINLDRFEKELAEVEDEEKSKADKLAAEIAELEKEPIGVRKPQTPKVEKKHEAKPMPPTARYKQLKSWVKRGDTLMKEEEDELKKLEEKYGEKPAPAHKAEKKPETDADCRELLKQAMAKAKAVEEYQEKRKKAGKPALQTPVEVIQKSLKKIDTKLEKMEEKGEKLTKTQVEAIEESIEEMIKRIIKNVKKKENGKEIIGHLIKELQAALKEL
jgi:hypothetical protein